MNPWKQLARELKYENPWIRVTEDKVINPSGNPGIYGIVHFKHLAIGILPLDTQGYTWLVGQFRYALDRYSWEIPEGGGDPDIDPIESAKRELAEETGISAKRWKRILEMDLSNSSTNQRSISFIAQDLSFGAAHPEDDEQLAVKRVHFDEAIEMVIRGEITDALAVATLLHAKVLMGLGKIRL